MAHERGSGEERRDLSLRELLELERLEHRSVRLDPSGERVESEGGPADAGSARDEDPGSAPAPA